MIKVKTLLPLIIPYSHVNIISKSKNRYLYSGTAELFPNLLAELKVNLICGFGVNSVVIEVE